MPEFNIKTPLEELAERHYELAERVIVLEKAIKQFKGMLFAKKKK